MAGQVVDAVILHPVQPASGISACPGQNVTLNCTVVRTVGNSMTEFQPVMSWIYRDTININSDGTNSEYDPDIFTAEFIIENFLVMSTATILEVSLSHHNSEIKCQAALALPESRNISIAGVTTAMHESCLNYVFVFQVQRFHPQI